MPDTKDTGQSKRKTRHSLRWPKPQTEELKQGLETRHIDQVNFALDHRAQNIASSCTKVKNHS